MIPRAAVPVPPGARLIAVGVEGDAVVSRDFARAHGGPRHRNELLPLLDRPVFLHARESLEFVRSALAA